MKTVVLVLLMFLVVLTPAIIWVIVTVRTANRRGKPDPQLRQQLLTAPQGVATRHKPSVVRGNVGPGLTAKRAHFP